MNDPWYESEEFLKTFWECFACHEKHQGKYAILHAWDCKKKIGDTVEFYIDLP